MPTKLQAKNAIDAAVVDIKDDIDNKLPSGVNIVDGNITFNPTRYLIVLDAGNQVTADSQSTSLETNLTNASRTFTKTFKRRSEDGIKAYVINEITNNGKLTTIIKWSS